MKKTIIIMDSRESNQSLKNILLRNPDIDLKIGTLHTGDFLINNKLLVERKTFNDLVASIKDGRLFLQAARLASSTKMSLMILEGTTRNIQSIKMKRESIQGALICLSLKYQIPIIRSTSPEETGKLLLLAWTHMSNKERIIRYYPNRPGPFKRDNKRKQQLFILQGLPGIGPVRAELLLNKFGTIRVILMADITNLKEITGIGKYTAQKIISILNENTTGYYPYLRNHNTWRHLKNQSR